MKRISMLITAFIFTCSFSCSAFEDISFSAKAYLPVEDSPLIHTGDAEINEISVEFTSVGNPSGVEAAKYNSQPSSKTLEEYMREEIAKHTAVIDISMYGVNHKYFASIYNSFIFCNSDLPVYTGCSETITDNIVTSFAPNYIYSSMQEDQSKIAELDELTDNLAAYAAKGKTDCEKVLYLFDKIVQDYYYTTTKPYTHKNRTAYGMMEDGHGVCQGYAILYSLVLDKLGIENYLCSNSAPEINHIWNYVKLDNEWYHCDATWGEMSDTSRVYHGYFLLSDSAMLSDKGHGAKADWRIQKPASAEIDCTSTKYENDYLFNFYHSPFYRDSKSIVFKSVFTRDEGVTIEKMNLRTEDLYTNGLILSEPHTYNDSTNIYLVTTKICSQPFKIAASGFSPTGKFRGCSLLNPSLPIPAHQLIPLPLPETTAGVTINYIITDSNLVPQGYASELVCP